MFSRVLDRLESLSKQIEELRADNRSLKTETRGRLVALETADAVRTAKTTVLIIIGSGIAGFIAWLVNAFISWKKG
jgi:hypothetical protein